MTNKEIFKKSLEKAVKNGFWSDKVQSMMDNIEGCTFEDCIETIAVTYFPMINQVLFDHEFAKAFWGTNTEFIEIDKNISLFYSCAYEYHLQQMVMVINGHLKKQELLDY